ncbi:hypothetical protein diail_8405 [Diaporthe ilicicola]|nr:hypothetical protein diail_8405 [Diaporthe ilicicola]
MPPTYGMYEVSASVNNVAVVTVELYAEHGFALRLDMINEALSSDPHIKVVFVCSPANPMGNLICESDAVQVLEHPTWNDGVVVDEAYVDFVPGPTRPQPQALIISLCRPPGCETEMDSRFNIALLNSTLKPVPQDKTFPLFSSLPKELRLQIWEEAIPRERLVRISLANIQTADGDDDQPVRYLEKNHLGKPISGHGYCVLAEDARLDHELLRVSREARQAVLNFYRIHIPCYCADAGTGSPEPKTLHINPEHDVLQIRAEAPVKQSLIDFLWDLKAYDPKHVGLLKLAVDLQGFCANDLQYLKRSDILLIRQRQALVGTLSQLQEVWFVYEEAGKNPYKRASEGPDDVVPFGGGMSAFESVGLDARDGAEAGLRRVYMGSVDPRELIWRWKRLLRTWEVRHQPGQVRYRLMVAQKPVSRAERWSVKSLGQAMELLSIRDQERRDDVESSPAVVGNGPPPEQSSQQEIRGMKTAAVGFWSFPLDAVGDVGEGERLCDMDFRPDRFLDMRSHWPELLLAKIS